MARNKNASTIRGFFLDNEEKNGALVIKELKNVTLGELAKGYVDNSENTEGGVYGWDGQLEIRPKFQRAFVVDGNIAWQTALVHSVLNNRPIGVMYFGLADNGKKYMNIDGQQRLMTLCSFINGDLTLKMLDKDLRRYGKAEDGINNYYDKAQKYKTDINSELEESKSKKKELNENSIRAIVAEALKQVLSQRLNEEMDDFKPHGYCCDSNWGGKEIEISDSGDAARIRTNYGDGPSKPSEWCEIQYDFQDEDGNDMDDGRPYILVNGEKEYLDNYMRYR